MTDYDSPWKEALELYFPAFLALFYREIHADIDWSRGFTFLDKELQKIMPKSARGRLYVDKLAKVWRKNGQETWVLMHIEVQTQRDADFPNRMYGYNTRIFIAYNRTVVSLPVLADDDPNWRPDHYKDELWGWSVAMKWPPVKLLDFANRMDELESGDNPFAKVVLAHLKALETRKDPESRAIWKLRLVRGLYERGFSSEDIRQLFRVIDWLMELPKELGEQFDEDLDEYEKGLRMPYVTSIERNGMLRLIRAALRAKFGDAANDLAEAISDLNDAEKYLTLNQTIATAATLDEVRRAYAKIAAPPRKKNSNGKRGASKP
jgi:hypothetical protein